jgi:hypothetical protein
VTLPVDLGDGTIHQPGDELELETAAAKLYTHALIALDEDKEGDSSARHS